MFLINLKRFLKSPVLVIGTLAYIVILYMMQPVHVAAGVEDISNSTLTTQAFSFLYFMMVSYEFFYQVKRHQLDEIVSVSKMGLLREKMYGLIIFITLNAIVYVIYVIVSMIGTTSVLKAFNMDWFLMLLKAYFFYHFLTYLFAILVGMLIAMINSRIKGFFALVMVFSLFSKIVYPIIMQCVNNSERWTHIFDILGIMNRNYYIYCDLIYNYTTECVNLQRISFWIMLTISIIFFVIYRKNKKLLTGTAFAVTCAIFVFYIQPSGERYVYGDWGAYMDEQQYYGLLYASDSEEYASAEDYDGIGRKYKASDFKITKYEGELCPERLLKADISIYVEQTDLEEYCFTLYHGYIIRKVTDEKGEELSFEQDVDHVLVKTNAAHNIEKINFEYEGYSKKYVATSQAVYLAGNFPYLPNAGWNEYMVEPIGDSWQVGYNLKGAMYPIYYDIKMDTKLTVYSNLTREENGHYTGKSEGATFVASPFVKKMKLRNCLVYYPVLAVPYWGENLEKTKREYEQAVDSVKGLNRDEENPLVFFALSSVMDADISWYIAEDHLIASPYELQELYTYYKESGCTIDHTKWDKENPELLEDEL